MMIMVVDVLSAVPLIRCTPAAAIFYEYVRASVIKTTPYSFIECQGH